MSATNKMRTAGILAFAIGLAFIGGGVALISSIE